MIFAVRAENSRTNYFLLQYLEEEKMHMDAKMPAVDHVGNVIYYGINYITGRLLDISDFISRHHEFKLQSNKKQYI